MKNDERMVSPRATSHAVKATRVHTLLESDTERRLQEASIRPIGMKDSIKEADPLKPERRLGRSPIVKEKLVQDSEMDQSSCLTTDTNRTRKC